MVTTYCDSNDVSSLLQLTDDDLQGNVVRKTFSETTLPTKTEVDDWINESEDYIDNYTYDSWRPKTVTNEYHDNYGIQYVRAGVFAAKPIFLNKMNIQDLDDAQGDKLEYFNGTAWIDLLTTGNKADGYGAGDFWVDIQEGCIYMHSRYGIFGPNQIRVTYRYGNATVPKDVKRACTLLAAATFMRSVDLIQSFSGNEQRLGQLNRVNLFTEEARALLERHKRFLSINY